MNSALLGFSVNLKLPSVFMILKNKKQNTVIARLCELHEGQERGGFAGTESRADGRKVSRRNQASTRGRRAGRGVRGRDPEPRADTQTRGFPGAGPQEAQL